MTIGGLRDFGCMLAYGAVNNDFGIYRALQPGFATSACEQRVPFLMGMMTLMFLVAGLMRSGL